MTEHKHKWLCKIGLHKWESDDITSINTFSKTLIVMTKHALYQYEDSDNELLEQNGCTNFFYCPTCGKTKHIKENTDWLKAKP